MQADIKFLNKVGYKNDINFQEGLKKQLNGTKFLKVYHNKESIFKNLSTHDWYYYACF